MLLFLLAPLLALIAAPTPAFAGPAVELPDEIRLEWSKVAELGPPPAAKVLRSQWALRKATAAEPETPVLRAELRLRAPRGWLLSEIRPRSRADVAVLERGDDGSWRVQVDQRAEGAEVAVELKPAPGTQGPGLGARPRVWPLSLYPQFHETFVLPIHGCPHYRLRVEPRKRPARALFVGYACHEDAEGAQVYVVRSEDASWERSPLTPDPGAAAVRTHVTRPREPRGADQVLTLRLRDADGATSDFPLEYFGGEYGGYYWLEATPSVGFVAESLDDKSNSNAHFSLTSHVEPGLAVRLGRTWRGHWSLFGFGEVVRFSYPESGSGHGLDQPYQVQGRAGVGTQYALRNDLRLIFDLGFSQEIFFLSRSPTLVTVDEEGVARARLTGSYDWIERGLLGSTIELSGGYYFPRTDVGYTINSSWSMGGRISCRGTGMPRGARPKLDGGFYYNRIDKNTTTMAQVSSEYGFDFRFTWGL